MQACNADRETSKALHDDPRKPYPSISPTKLRSRADDALTSGSKRRRESNDPLDGREVRRRGDSWEPLYGWRGFGLMTWAAQHAVDFFHTLRDGSE